MSEELFTCPDCAHENFTERGLRSHRGNKTCLKRQGSAGDSPAVVGDSPNTSLAVVEPQVLVMMTEKEAREKTDAAAVLIIKVEREFSNTRRLLFELHQREGWRVLGYQDFVAYAKAEFGISKTHTYRLTTAGRIETILSTEENLSQSQVAELSRLPDHLVPVVWQQATIEGRPKSSALKYAVDTALGVQPKTKAKPKAPRKPKPSESVQVILKPVLGITLATWKPRAAEGVTLTFHLNRETDLERLLTSLDNVKAEVEAAVQKLYAEAAPTASASYAETLTPETHSDY